MGLSSDPPWNSNRYGYGGGNPINRIEYDGHINWAGEDLDGAYSQIEMRRQAEEGNSGPTCDIDFTRLFDFERGTR